MRITIFMRRMIFLIERFSFTPALPKEREDCRPLVWNDGRPCRSTIPMHPKIFVRARIIL